MAGTKAAKAKYAKKVCDNYLGIRESGCEEAFDKLIDNMKASLKAMG